MDLQKSKIYLDKLNREFARMAKDPENIVRLDVDIMASYVRELYDAILSDEAASQARHDSGTHKKSPARPVEPIVQTPVAPPPPPPPPVIEPQPVVAVQEEPAAPPPPPPPPPPVIETKPAPPATPKEPVSTPQGLEVLFEEKQVKELSDKLSELPIPDLKKAIALNDRLLLTSELFAGDGKAFEHAINAINHLGSFDDAQTYLLEHCVVRYAWTDKKRIDTAKNFIKLVRRRFK